MILLPPISSLTVPLLSYTTLFRSHLTPFSWDDLDLHTLSKPFSPQRLRHRRETRLQSSLHTKRRLDWSARDLLFEGGLHTLRSGCRKLSLRLFRSRYCATSTRSDANQEHMTRTM